MGGIRVSLDVTSDLQLASSKLVSSNAMMKFIALTPYVDFPYIAFYTMIDGLEQWRFGTLRLLGFEYGLETENMGQFEYFGHFSGLYYYCCCFVLLYIFFTSVNCLFPRKEKN